MDGYTMILDFDDDGAIRFSSDTLGGARVAIRRGGQPERVVQVRSVQEAEIEQYVRGYNACELCGVWHGLDAARDIVCDAARQIIADAGELLERLHVPIASRSQRLDPAELLADTHDADPQLTVAERAAERVLEAIRELRIVRNQAAEEISGADDSSAPDAQHQRPRLIRRRG